MNNQWLKLAIYLLFFRIKSFSSVRVKINEEANIPSSLIYLKRNEPQPVRRVARFGSAVQVIGLKL